MFPKYSVADRWLLSLFYALLFVDSINGLFLGLGHGIPIGATYKFLLLALFIIRMIQTRKGAILFLLFLLYESFYIFLLAEKFYCENIFETLSLFSKFLVVCFGYPIMVALAKKNNAVYLQKTKEIVILNSIVIGLNIIIGMLGFGFSTYYEAEEGTTLGSKGFFYAVNEISGVIIFLFGFLIFYYKQKFSTKKFLVLFLILLFCIVSFGTKTAMGGVLFFYIYLQYSMGRKNKTLLLLMLLIFVPLFLYIGYLVVAQNGIWERWVYFYERSDDIFTFLLSGRDAFWESMKRKFFASGSIGVLFGIGGNLTVEMDPFDALMNFGIIGTVMVYSFWLYMTYNAFKLSKTNLLAKAVLFLDIEVIAFSLFAGHLMFSGLMGPFVPLLNALCYIPNKVLFENLKR